MFKRCALVLVCLLALSSPVGAQLNPTDARTAVLIVNARQATANDDLAAASGAWRAPQSLLDSQMSVAAYIDPRYYYITRWLGRTLMAEDRSGDAEAFLRDACSRAALTSSLRTDDVRATVNVYLDALRKNGKPQQAQETITMWNEVMSMTIPPTTPALSGTPSVSQATPSALSSSTAGGSSTPSASSAMGGSPERKKALDELKRELFAIPSPVPAPGVGQ